MFSIRHYLAELLLGTSVLLAFSSCSLLAGPSSTSLNIEEASNAGWKEVLNEPYVYEVSNDSSGITYMTAIKECERKTRASPLVATRQLLVGLKDIRIESQESISLANLPAACSHIKARLEDHELNLLTYTVPVQDCVYDFVFWRNSGDTGTGETQLISASSTYSQFLSAHFQRLVE